MPSQTSVRLLVPTLCLLAACASHEPAPPDLSQHLREWAALDLKRLGERLAEPDDPAQAHDHSHAYTSGGIDPHDGLTLDEARRVAIHLNPGLRSARAELKTDQARARYAGLWDDPSLELDALRIAQNVPERYILGGALELALPIFGTRAIEKAAAEAEADAALQALADAELDMIGLLEGEWNEWSAVTEKLRATSEHLEALEELIRIADALADAGELRRAEARLFRIHRAETRSEIHHLLHTSEAMEMELRALAGLRPDAPIRLVPVITHSHPPLKCSAELEASLATRHPRLLALEARCRAAEENFKLEVRRQLPEPKLGGRFGREDGLDRFGLGLALPLPVWNRNRGSIAEARAGRDAARVMYEAEADRIVTALHVTAGRHAAALEDHRMAREELMPLAREQIEEVRALASLGELDALLLFESLRTALEARFAVIETALEVSLEEIELRHLLPPDMEIESGAAAEHDHAEHHHEEDHEHEHDHEH